MADKKLITYECNLSFSFRTKDNDFMNPDFDFNHISLVLDTNNGGSIFLVGNSKTKHPFISCDLKDVFFHCSDSRLVDLTSKDVCYAVLSKRNFVPFGDCVFSYNSLEGSPFILGVNEKDFLNEKKEIRSANKPKKFSRRCRNKTSELG